MEKGKTMGNNYIDYPRQDKEIYEFSFCWNGFKFQIIYGQMHNGDYEQWFISLPEEGICCIAAEPMNIYTNENHLLRQVGYEKKAKAIASAVMQHYVSFNYEKKGE